VPSGVLLARVGVGAEAGVVACWKLLMAPPERAVLPLKVLPVTDARTAPPRPKSWSIMPPPSKVPLLPSTVEPASDTSTLEAVDGPEAGAKIARPPPPLVTPPALLPEMVLLLMLSEAGPRAPGLDPPRAPPGP